MAKPRAFDVTTRVQLRERTVRLEPTAARYYGYEAKFAEWATSNGWDVTKRGWPDFICRRDGALMAVEVKGGGDTLSPEQIDTLDNLAAAGLPTYVYHDGLGLKRWRGRRVESVANLKAEISELYELIRKVVQVRDEMVPNITTRVPEWNLEAELDVVIEWCGTKHSHHKRYGTRMTSCSWVYYFREKEGRDFDEIVTMMGEGTILHARAHHRKAKAAVEAARNRAAA